MRSLSSECRHDESVESSMANDSRNDAPTLPATQAVDNASNNRQRVIDSAASMSNSKYQRYEEHDKKFKYWLPAQASPDKENAVIHQATKEQLLSDRRDEHRPHRLCCWHPSMNGQIPMHYTNAEQCEESNRPTSRPPDRAGVCTLQRKDWSLVRAAHLPSELPKCNSEHPYDPPIRNSRAHHSQAPRRQPRDRKPFPPPFHSERLRNDHL
jgi:hypothetical protein